MIRTAQYLRPLFLTLLYLLAYPVSAAQPVSASTLDVSRLAGQWYEIASYPNLFQRGCAATNVEYGMRDGGITLKTRCRKDTLAGEWKESEGNVRVVAPGKLKVSFFWPFEGDYWVLAHSASTNCGWVLVGSPDHDYLWVYSRSPQLPDAVYAEITERAAALGYELKTLRRTLQSTESIALSTQCASRTAAL